MVRVELRLPPDLWQRLDEEAEKKNASTAALIRARLQARLSIAKRDPLFLEELLERLRTLEVAPDGLESRVISMPAQLKKELKTLAASIDAPVYLLVYALLT